MTGILADLARAKAAFQLRAVMDALIAWDAAAAAPQTAQDGGNGASGYPRSSGGGLADPDAKNEGVTE